MLFWQNKWFNLNGSTELSIFLKKLTLLCIIFATNNHM
nr:MAG TPA: hypothetical protein [Caudoviricetes sp.]